MARPCCHAVSRRLFLADMEMDFQFASAPHCFATGSCVPAARRRLICRFPHLEVCGDRAQRPERHLALHGRRTSHVETFDPEPELRSIRRQDNHDAVQSALDSPYFKKNMRRAGRWFAQGPTEDFPDEVGCRNGVDPAPDDRLVANLAKCVDDIAFVRSMTTDNAIEPSFDSTPAGKASKIPRRSGSQYATSSTSSTTILPQFIVLRRPIPDCCGGAGASGATLSAGAQRRATGGGPQEPAAICRRPGPDVYHEEQQRRLLGRLNRLASSNIRKPGDPARIPIFYGSRFRCRLHARRSCS